MYILFIENKDLLLYNWTGKSTRYYNEHLDFFRLCLYFGENDSFKIYRNVQIYK